MKEYSLQLIDSLIESWKVSHAYLFNSPNQDALEKHVIYLINQLENKNYKDYESFDYDINFIDGSNNEINRETIDNLILKISSSALDKNMKKIVVIKDIEKGNASSLNAILKTLEEPSANTVFIFTTTQIRKVLRTLQSRSQIINVKNISRAIFVNDLMQNSIYEKNALILSHLFNSFSELKRYYVEEFSSFLDGLKDALEKSKENFTHLRLFLSEQLAYKNYFLFVKTLKLFFICAFKNDQQVFDYGWNSIIERFYIQKSTKAYDLISCIDKFLIIDEKVNFFLQKSHFLNELEKFPIGESKNAR